MEAILVDVKRAMRSLQRTMHAVSGALLHGVDSLFRKAGRYRARPYRAIGGGFETSDVYGRKGRADIYSSREMARFYGRMTWYP
ncbi:MAG: hypothetical protein CVV53_00820 [Spirochaetae bacterium HGW-Spirochaetae-9]|nr:MAG: hypothetical protein CVV53_00820 [Spirochaetae bacterium HGW-Spirochaetae-9]